MIRFFKVLFAAAIAAGMPAARAETFKAVSPDALNEIRLETGEKGMAYSVWRRGKTVVEPVRFSLEVEGRGVLNGACAVSKVTTRKVEGTLATPLYKKAEVNLAADETRVDFDGWTVVLPSQKFRLSGTRREASPAKSGNTRPSHGGRAARFTR